MTHRISSGGPGRASLTRRTFMMATGVGAAGLLLPGCGDDAESSPDASRPDARAQDAAPADGSSFDAGPDPYAGLDTDSYLGELTMVATIEPTTAKRVTLEGPAMGPDGRIYFTNMEESRIMVYDPESNEVSVFLENSNGANGLHFDRDGTLLACEGGRIVEGNDLGRVVRINIQTGERTVLADRYEGKELQPPNDLTIDGNGRIYFSSRPKAGDATDEIAGTVNAVYRIDPDGTLTRLIAWPVAHRPNGLATSPGDSILYVIEAHPAENFYRQLLAYDLDDEGNIANRRIIYDFYPGRAGDGMRVDAEGNLYIAAGLHNTRMTSETLATKPGIHVFSPTGELLAFRQTPFDLITNCAFAGDNLRTMYVTCGNSLFRMSTVKSGKGSYLPRPQP